MDTSNATALRIKARWSGQVPPVALNRQQGTRHRPMQLTLSGVPGNTTIGSTYGASDLTLTNSDFQGDWRSADSWMRFDLHRVRARCRQLERGNPWGISFTRSLIANVLGSGGINTSLPIKRSKVFGDFTEGEIDQEAVAKIKLWRKDYESKPNFTTRKKHDRIDFDAMVLARLFWDGEVIVREIKNFPGNEHRHSWQMVNPDYLDHNLNRVLENGNMIKMGVELDKEWRYPVAYWFFKRRPNDYFYNYNEFNTNIYFRVDASEVLHIFHQTFDEEQTRGFPTPFASAINLHRLGKYEESALINATIGASKMGFFKKTVPDQYEGGPEDLTALQNTAADGGGIIDEVSPGSWTELPWNFEPVEFNPQYPAEQFGAFEKAMLHGIAACLGSSYATLTGDLSEANFSSSRVGLDAEREGWMMMQSFFIRQWKAPEFSRSLDFALMTQKLKLPYLKLDKYNVAEFTGRRWGYVNPKDDAAANESLLNNRLTSISRILRSQNIDPDELFDEIARENEKLKELDIERVQKASQPAQGGEEDDDGKKTDPKKPKKPAKD